MYTIKILNVTEKNKYRKFVDIFKYLFGLTDRQLDIFALLIRIQENWNQEDPINVVDTRSRRNIMRNTYINKNNLTKYISLLKKKNILIENEIGWEIDPRYMPVIKEDGSIEVTFSIKPE